ncbi:KGK domain-containing protein [Okeanomitos corallinicola TIOX110]|uniref:KGK domain-containing protein n=1 Tax=Okeanomitos corallinicola TIOX110 TaxID=3133117 RepID=A0ABZ2UQE1_9CYAN
MDEKFEILDIEEGDVVIDFHNATFKLSKLSSAMKDQILSNGLRELNNRLNHQGGGELPAYKNEYWIDKGVNSEVLKPGKNWQKGKCRIKVTLEFCPDEPEVEEIPEIKEPESPLDDLRRQINDLSS